MMNIRIQKPMDKELWTFTTIELTSGLPWNPEEINEKDMNTKEYDYFVSQAKYYDRESRKIKPRNDENIPPITSPKGEIVDITQLAEFNVNEDILYLPF